VTTPAERRALDRIRRGVAQTYPGIASAILDAIRAMQGTPIADIERALLAGGPDAVIREVFSEERVNSDLAAARRAILDTVDASGQAAVRQVLPTVSFGFDILAPQVLERVQTMATVALGQFSRDVAATVRAEAERGLLAGENPRTTARRIRDAVGMAPNQAEAAQNFRNALEVAGTNKDALGYALRDRRFDPLLARIRREGGALSVEQIDRMTEAYQRRMVAYHAETIARTTALDANKLGQELAFEQAADAGALDTERLVKRWVTTLDGRERPEHAEMDGVEVMYDDPWLVPGAGPQMYPGEGEYNCRCAAVYRLLPRGASLPA
jgi:hypothetical protein